jgi:hypothetical protein
MRIVDTSRPEEERAAAEAADARERALPPTMHRAVALVVVHGMGKQRTSETLVEWAEPLLRRIDWIAGSNPATNEINNMVGAEGNRTRDRRATLQSPVRFSHVDLSSNATDTVEASVSYRGADGRLVELSLSITEARWAQAFLAMKRSEVFNWGAGFVWRAASRLAAYYSRVFWLMIWRIQGIFGLPVTRVRSLGAAAWAALGWLCFVLAFVIVGAMVSAIWAVLFGLALILWLLLPFFGLVLFFPVFSSALQSAVDTLVEFVGDAAVWVQRPVRAAAMRTLVRGRITEARAWLDARPPEVAKSNTSLVVLAHSEGATISSQTLFNRMTGEPPVLADALVTVGAAVTLLGSSRWNSDNAIVTRVRAWVAGVSRVWPAFDPVSAWQEIPGTRWLNFWGIWDPVATGPISTSARNRRRRWAASYRAHLTSTTEGKVAFDSSAEDALPAGPEEHPVHNTASPLTDHQTYSSNIVQVIDPVARLIMDKEIAVRPIGADTTELERFEYLRNRLHVRSVKEMGVQRLLVILVALTTITAPALYESIGGRVTAAVLWLFGNPTNGPLTWLAEQVWFVSAVVAISTAAIGLWANGRLWRRYVGKVTWNRDRLPRFPWVGGLVLRIALIGLAWLLYFVIANRTSPMSIWEEVIAGGLGVVIVFAPWAGLVPLIVDSNPRRR